MKKHTYEGEKKMPQGAAEDGKVQASVGLLGELMIVLSQDAYPCIWSQA